MSAALAAGKQIINLLRLRSFPILQQLRLEECLLRASPENWCILNDGTQPPAIVMGISGDPEALLEMKKVVHDPVPVIKRFSGGGTVIVDHDTVFVTLICREGAIRDLPLFPRPIASWTEKFYKPVFKDNDGFHLRESDYVFGERKFGGSAQSITKDRWLHHTSFLWDYHMPRMAYLKIPKRAPEYRAGRTHEDFICKLRDHYSSRSLFLTNVEMALPEYFDVRNVSLDEISSFNHQPRTKLFTTEELRSIMKKVTCD